MPAGVSLSASTIISTVTMSSSSMHALGSQPQPSRPDHRPYEFVPLRGPRGKEFDEAAQIQLHVLCAKCKALEEMLRGSRKGRRIKYRKTVLHYETIGLLRDSSKHGCHLCTLIWGSFVRRRYGNGCSITEMAGNREKTKLEDVKIKIILPWGWERLISYFRQEGFFSLSNFINIFAVERLPVFPLPVSISTTTSHASFKSFYMKCSDICDKTHTKCHMKKVEQLPTRLLRATPPAPNGTGTAQCVKLVSTGDEGLEADTKYAALSYCWGQEHEFRLTGSNLKSLAEEGIPVDQLPATIQDAIFVTIELGLQYLWVDALCIIQDSKEDWSREAEQMCNVYQGCSVALAASGASDSREGLFAARDPLQEFPCALLDTMIARYRKEEDEQEWALQKRGWALQENLLPARTIKFGSHMIWECRELSVNEYGVDPSWDFPSTSLKKDFWSLILEPEVGDPVDVHKIYNLWWRILETYSSSKLSRKSDRLPAIAGLTSAIQRRTEWTFSWGLWQPFTIQGLLWRRNLGTVMEPTRSGPSWSWASYDGGVIFPLSESRKPIALAEFIRIPTSLPAEIELSGILCQIPEPRGLYIDVEGSQASVDVMVKYDQKDRPKTGSEMFLPLCMECPNMASFVAVLGLIVVPARCTAFKRVGDVEIISPREDSQVLTEVLKGSDGKPPVRQKILLV